MNEPRDFSFLNVQHPPVEQAPQDSAEIIATPEREPISISRFIANQNNPELAAAYEQILKNAQSIQAENTRLRKELEDNQLLIQDFEEEIRNLSFDSITQLRTRSFFYKQLNNLVTRHIHEIIPYEINHMETASLQQVTETIDTIGAHTFEAVPLTVMMGDVAYLSLANGKSHALGDELLGKVGLSAQRVMDDFTDTTEFFRYGGDEITGIIRAENPSVVQHITDNFSTEVSKTEFSYLQSLGIDSNLHIDTGTSSFAEGIAVFQKLLIAIEENNKQVTTPEDHINILPGERLRAFVDVWLRIADERSIVHKAEKRIPMLKFYKEHHPAIYTDIVSALRKGALGITDHTLDALPPESEAIRLYVLNTRAEKNIYKETQSPTLKALTDDIINQTIIFPEILKLQNVLT